MRASSVVAYRLRSTWYTPDKDVDDVIIKIPQYGDTFPSAASCPDRALHRFRWIFLLNI